MDTNPSIDKSSFSTLVKDLFAMSRLISVGASLTDAWAPFVTHEENASIKAFFQKADQNWKELPRDVPLRFAPTFTPYASMSREWKLLSDAVSQGEESGMLESDLLSASMLILLSWKLQKEPLTDSDKKLFVNASSMFYQYDWSAWPEFHDAVPNPDMPLGQDPGIWLSDQHDQAFKRSIAPSTVPSYVTDALTTQTQTAGLSDGPALQMMTDFNTVVDFYQ